MSEEGHALSEGPREGTFLVPSQLLVVLAVLGVLGLGDTSLQSPLLHGVFPVSVFMTKFLFSYKDRSHWIEAHPHPA